MDLSVKIRVNASTICQMLHLLSMTPVSIRELCTLSYFENDQNLFQNPCLSGVLHVALSST